MVILLILRVCPLSFSDVLMRDMDTYMDYLCMYSSMYYLEYYIIFLKTVCSRSTPSFPACTPQSQRRRSHTREPGPAASVSICAHRRRRPMATAHSRPRGRVAIEFAQEGNPLARSRSVFGPSSLWWWPGPLLVFFTSPCAVAPRPPVHHAMGMAASTHLCAVSPPPSSGPPGLLGGLLLPVSPPRPYKSSPPHRASTVPRTRARRCG